MRHLCMLKLRQLTVSIATVHVRAPFRCLSTSRPKPLEPFAPAVSSSGGSYVCMPSSQPFLSLTIGQVLEKAATDAPNNTAVVVKHQNIRKTYSELEKDARTLAASFLAIGLQKGDRVGIWGPSSYEWVITQFATAISGLILVNINPAYQASELEYCLKLVQCSAIVAAEKFKTQDYYQMLNTVSPDLEASTSTKLKLEKLPNLRSIIITAETAKPGAWTFTDLLKEATSDHFKALDKANLQFDDPINIQFTSGTTGLPKAATLSHFNIVNNAFFVGHRIGFAKKVPVICMQVPLYHCFGCVLGTLSSALFQGTCVIPAPNPQPESSMKAIHEEGCTIVYGTPTMYIDMLGLPNFETYDCSTLKTGIMSGSICPEELIKNVKKTMGIEDILIPYGCTETSPVCTLTCIDDPEVKKNTTVGKPLDFVEVKVVSKTGAIVPLGDTGEVCLRGHSTFLGYWQEDDKTKESLKSDKWYYTGDLGKMDESGYLYIVGRKKDMIIRGGENIYPREIEEFLMSHPQIADVQVVGVPDKRLGEEVCAWIQLKNNSNSIKEEDIKVFCKGKISYFKIPRHIIFTEVFPKTVTGKVQKFKLRSKSVEVLGLTE